MSELLVEVLSEEIPARMQKGAQEQLEQKLVRALTKVGYRFNDSDVKAYVTSRRLVFVAKNLIATPERSPGPQLRKEIYEGMRAFRWPKSMRWPGAESRWVRPIRSLVCLLDGQPPHPSFLHELFQVSEGNVTRGHRREGNSEITVSSVDDYLHKMKENGVMLDREERISEIKRQCEVWSQAKFAEGGKSPIVSHVLLEELGGLCEWPTVLSGRIDEDCMSLPDEVIISVMERHQRFFAVQDHRTKKLAPVFLMVADGRIREAEDEDRIIRGNERVLRARLADARYFYQRDKRQLSRGAWQSSLGVGVS